ncbi:MAG: adenine methyltransferase [Phycisphaerae bacterium SG8_4]|nr:MAG: adenine methyltransferase [Phycisphaerae bacterium SG8_4]
MTTKCKTRLTPPLKWHGGKSYLADWIIDLMPRHLHYVEPFGGGLAVLLAKNPFDERHQWSEKSFEKGISEVVNDLNRELMNFWKVLQDEESFGRFRRIVEATPFSQPQWHDAGTRMMPRHESDIEAAVAFFVRCRQSRAGGFKSFATLSRNRTRRRMNEQASAWLNCIEGLADVHDRLKRVVVLCEDALKVITQQDGERTLFYLDPPYVHNTRSTTDAYQYEMHDSVHSELLSTIRQCRGRVMLSGYPNELYDLTLGDWNRHDRKIDNKVSSAASKRVMTESLWCNF